jgi:hypothetical protein
VISISVYLRCSLSVVSQNRVRIRQKEPDHAVLISVLELDKFGVAFWEADLTVDKSQLGRLGFYRCHLGIHVVARTQIKRAVIEWSMQP